MDNKVKKIIASFLLIISSLALLSITHDRFVRLFIITCILFSLIYLRKRNIRKVERDKRIKAELSKEEEKKQ